MDIEAAHAQNIIAFDAPGAGTGFGQGTLAFAINPSGTITGVTRDTNLVRHVFLRDRKGNYTIFDAPGAGTSARLGTRAFSINAAGTITGWYDGNSGPAHGYVRTAGGTDTTGEGTFPYFSAVISNSGGVTGYYVGSDGETHGFVRTPDGTITEFDPTGSLFTRGVAINSAGAVTGLWVEEQMSSFACHGFLRAPGGTITSFDVPGAGSDCVDSQGTFSSALLPNGAIEGAYVDSSGVIHGFVGFPGAFTTFDVSASGTGSGQGTEPINNNPSGAITGVYSDANNLIHGFLYIP